MSSSTKLSKIFKKKVIGVFWGEVADFYDLPSTVLYADCSRQKRRQPSDYFQTLILRTLRTYLHLILILTPSTFFG